MLSTIVFTSLNPFGRTELQLECFKGWKQLDVDIRTLNNAHEKALLLDLGLEDHDILELDESETGDMFFNKPVPRITALFERAANGFEGRKLVIVNSDIYPAARSAGFIDAYLELGPALALTREEVGSLNRPPARSNHPYRGGLDTFMFKPWAVKQMAERLAVWGSSERMAFGVPGWDFLVGSQIVSSQIGGRILDGSLLLHVSHPQTYSNIDEFGHFIEPMQSLDAVNADTIADAAEEFAQKINAMCIEHVAESRRVWACYYKPPATQELPSARAMEVARDTAETVVWASWNYSFSELARFADERLQADKPSLEAASAFFCRHPEYDHQFGEVLLALMFEYACAHPSPRPVKSEYPKFNMHAAAVERILKNTAHSEPHRRVEIARLFCRELLEYDIFNVRLYDWMGLSCKNEDERTLVAKVRKIWEEAKHEAA
ncbi:MAG: hypothetical protein JJ873_12395 [Maricaulis sp.]|uniref:hypothetical protein n=1 Tax=Maricaulis sp. TaxID=1486257 RepID=UPI001AFDA567|nr:hypothetical protein [Maricaulis sp.]MBO6728437.1 hypothetical protein [Maricaulis sp.]MBO6878200.1 hypothetical protein [Maricaulis sp.]